MIKYKKDFKKDKNAQRKLRRQSRNISKTIKYDEAKSLSTKAIPRSDLDWIGAPFQI